MKTTFENGLRQAESVIRKDPSSVEYWLGRARTSRRRWRTWLLDRKKYGFLSGFIAGLEAHREGDSLGVGRAETPEAAG